MGMTNEQWKDSLRTELRDWETMKERMDALQIDDITMRKVVDFQIKRINESLES